MTTTAEFASLLVRLTSGGPAFDTIGEAACLRLFDTLGAAAIGFHTDEGRAMRHLCGAGRDDFDDLCAGDLLRLLTVAIRCTEIDDINIDSCTTVGSVVVPAVLAAAMAGPSVSGSDMIAGLAAGYEATVRLGEAIDGASILYRGVWPTYVTAPFAAAAAAGTVWKLPPERMAHALSLALARTGVLATAGSGGVSPRSWLLSMACLEGYEAARAAACGFAGNGGELAAFSARHGIELDEELLLREDRRPAVLSVDTKPYPTARQALSAIEAFRALLPLPFPADDIEAVEVSVPAQVRDMIARAPDGRIGSMVSVAYQMALALFAPARLHDALRERVLADAQISGFTARVALAADAGLTSLFPAVWGARVNVRSKSGRECASEVLDPIGSAQSPPGWEDLSEKLSGMLDAGKIGRSDAIRLLARGCREVGRPGPIHIRRDLLRPLTDAAGLRN